MLPHTYQHLIGIPGIYYHITHTATIIRIQNFCPGFTTIRRFKDPSFWVRTVRISNGTCINYIRIIRINDYSVNISSFLKTHQLPCLTCIHAFVNTFAKTHAISRISFSCSYPNDARIRLANCNTANVLYGLFIKHGLPVSTGIFSLPHTATCSTYINGIWICVQSIYCGNTSAHATRTNGSGF